MITVVNAGAANRFDRTSLVLFREIDCVERNLPIVVDIVSRREVKLSVVVDELGKSVRDFQERLATLAVRKTRVERIILVVQHRVPRIIGYKPGSGAGKPVAVVLVAPESKDV